MLLPPSGPILNALARLDPLPSISGPSPDVSAPPPRIARAPGVRAASRSVVRVLGTACGLAIEGSGWVAAPDVVVTNAHVVAGEQDTTVQVGGRSPSLPARAIAFDPTDDVAVLSVPGLGLPALRARRRPAVGRGRRDPRLPGERSVRRALGAHRAHADGAHRRRLRPRAGARACSRRCAGSCARATPAARSSTADGGVLTTVFAGTVGGGPHGGYGVANATVARVLAAGAPRAQRRAQSVSTEGCAAG